MTLLPESPLDILLHGLIGVDYILHLSTPLSAPLSSATSPSSTQSSTRFAISREIEREERVASGLMWRVAELLRAAGLRVALSGNALGDDSNGRLVERENQARDWLHPKRVASLETPYRVVLQTPHEPTVVLSRCQAARRHDREEFGSQSSTRLKPWPRARLVCCSDELPFSALSLARFAHAERIPLWLVSSGTISTDEQTRVALDELRSLSAIAPLAENGDVEELAAQLRVNLRLLEDGLPGRIGAE